VSLNLDAIKARCDAATRGPWGWRGHSDGAIELRTLHSGGLRIVSGMNARPCWVESNDSEMILTSDACGACRRNYAKYMAGEDLDDHEKCEHPENLGTIWMWDNGFVSPANKWARNEQTYRTDVARVEHPDAEFLAHAREDVPALLAEVERLKDGIRDIASREINNPYDELYDLIGEP